MSGEVKTYKTHERLTWAQFKELPDDLAAEHIAYLVDTFGVNIKYIAVALGVSDITVSKYLKEHGIKVKKSVFRPTSEWLAFMSGSRILTAAIVSTEEMVVEEPAVAEQPAEPEKVAPFPSLQFLRGNLVLKGPKGQVLQRLFEVLPDNVTVDVHFLAEGAEGAVAGAARPYWFTV